VKTEGTRNVPTVLNMTHTLIPKQVIQKKVYLVFNLFIHSLFNNAFSCSDYTVSNERMIANELERMWKEVVVA
jgi:hypothetical protein